MKTFKVIDLSRSLESGMPQSLSLPRFGIWQCLLKDWGDQVNCNALMIAEHIGTNCDAPYHALKKGKKIDDLAIDAFIGPGIVIDLTYKDPKSVISKVEIQEKEKEQGVCISENDIVLLRTDFDDTYWGNSPTIAKKLMERPTIGTDAAEYLISRRIKAVGMDTGSPDISGTDLPVHRLLLSNSVLIIETLTNLSKLPKDNFLFIALPLKIKGGSGSPVRAAAIVFD